MIVDVCTDAELIERIKSSSVRAHDRDVPDSSIECWREYGKEHYFLHGAYWHTLPTIPLP